MSEDMLDVTIVHCSKQCFVYRKRFCSCDSLPHCFFVTVLTQFPWWHSDFLTLWLGLKFGSPPPHHLCDRIGFARGSWLVFKPKIACCGGGIELGTSVLLTKGVAHCAMASCQAFSVDIFAYLKSFLLYTRTVAVFHCATVTQPPRLTQWIFIGWDWSSKVASVLPQPP